MVTPLQMRPVTQQDYRKVGLCGEVGSVCLQVNELMRVLKKPFEEQAGAEKYRVAAPKEIRMGVELLSCSS